LQRAVYVHEHRIRRDIVLINNTADTGSSHLSLHDALPILYRHERRLARPLLASALLLFYIGCAFAWFLVLPAVFGFLTAVTPERSEEHTSELQSRENLVCRLLLEKKKINTKQSGIGCTGNG